MGKTSPLIDLMGDIFRHITAIHSILNNSNELKKVYVKTNFDDTDEVEKLIKATKELIDNLEKKTTKLHTYFNTNYTSCIKDLSTSACNGNAAAKNDSLNKTNVDSDKEAPQINTNSDNEVDSTEPAERNKSSIENGIDTNAPSNSDIVDNNSQTVSNNQENQSNDAVVEECSKDVTVDEQPDSTDAAKVFLKCVDISKLVNPSILPHLTTPKSASKRGNDPVFIILDSDSDDGASKSSTNRRKSAKANAKVLKGKKDNLWNNRNEPKVIETSSNAGNSWSQKRSTRTAKKKKITYVISSSSEVSSLSDIVSDSEDDLPKKKRAPRSKQAFNEKQILSSQSDKKLSYKAYVRLERVPCEKLKENYLKKRERLEIERLTNLNSLQKRCRSPANSTDSGKKTKRNRKEKSKDVDGNASDSSAVSVLADVNSTQADDQAVCNAAIELTAYADPDHGEVSDSNPLGIVLDAINSELQESHKSDDDSDQNNERRQEQSSKEKDESSGSAEVVIIEANNDKSQEKENQPDVTNETNNENDATQAKEKEKLNASEGEGNKNNDETTKDKENDCGPTDDENKDKDDEKEKSKDKESDEEDNCDGDKNKKSKKKDTTDDESSCEDIKKKKSKEKEKHSSSEADKNSGDDKNKSKEKQVTDDESDHEDKKRKTKGSVSSDESNETDTQKKSKKAETTDESDDHKKRKKKKKAKRSTSSDDESSDDDKKKKNEKGKRSNSSGDESSSDDGKKKKSKKKHSTDDESDDDKKRKKKKKAKHSSFSEDENSDDDKKKKQKSKHSSDDESESDSNKKKKSEKKEKGKWRKDKLLTSTLSETDSEEELEKHKKRRERKKLEAHNKRSKKKAILSDSDEKDKEYQASGSSNSSSSSESEKEEKLTETKKRRRIKRVNDSSEDEDGNKSTRKTIRKVIANESLAESTKKAEKEEKERKARILQRQKKYNQIFDGLKDATLEKLVLDFDEESKKELLSVNPAIVKKLKPHQGNGIQFMWDTCYESVERAKSTAGSGCILAHCMGLGKTLQVVALTHALLTNDEITNVKNVLVVCPLNTVLNWESEYKRWLRDVEGPEVNIFELVSSKNNAREFVVEDWYKEGGVLIIGYDMFRNLTNPTNKRLKKKAREIFQRGLVNPGPDLVVCDEGHLLKNEKTNLSIAMNRIRSARRIVLTGTPMQNNLKEYYCMVQFVKPNLLGTYKEYINRFVNPITNGQYTDSTPHDINIMRKRSHVLHTMLDGIVQRKDYCVLTPYLPPKHEYVLFLKLTPLQIKLYQHYKNNFSQRPSEGKIKSSFLFKDFQEFQRICTHPQVLLMKSKEVQARDDFLSTDEDSEGSLKEFIDDGSEKSSSSSSSSESDGELSDKSSDSKKKATKKPQKRMTRNSAAARGIDVEEIIHTAPQGWWGQYCSEEDYEDIKLSTKLYLLFKIIQECDMIGDKLLVFSQSLLSLNVIEYFLAKIDEATQQDKSDSVCGFSGSWSLGQDYFRIDGSTSCDNRLNCCKLFNDKDNLRARLFLISTKAGGLGINLVGANRVVIFDVSWNPSHDTQSIYRVYRFGQTKPCYIYRFVMWGTMETKIYERQVTKQAISKRVIDEQQIDRHYNQTDLAELYQFDPEPNEDIIPLVPKDVLLGELLQKEKDRIFKYHEHQSLLENKEDEELNEAERKAAWEEFEHEKTTRVTVNASTLGWIKNLPISSIHIALRSIVQRDNPTWSSEQIMCVVPSIVQQLRVQVDEGKYLLFERVVEEIRNMQVNQQKNFQDYLKRQQQFQHQQQQQQMHVYQQHLRQQMFPQMNTSDVVELID